MGGPLDALLRQRRALGVVGVVRPPDRSRHGALRPLRERPQLSRVPVVGPWLVLAALALAFALGYQMDHLMRFPAALETVL